MSNACGASSMRFREIDRECLYLRAEGLRYREMAEV
jgi:hypothetical protein